MKKDIHPDYRYVVFRDDAADFQIITRSTMETRDTIEVDGTRMAVRSTRRRVETRRHESLAAAVAPADGSGASPRRPATQTICAYAGKGNGDVSGRFTRGFLAARLSPFPHCPPSVSIVC